MTFALPLEAFVSLTRAPLPTLGRIDTLRAFLDSDLPPSFFTALAGGSTRICLADTVAIDGGTAAMKSVGPGSAPPAETEPTPIEGYLATQAMDLRAGPPVFIEDVRRPGGPDRFAERERRQWLERTIVETSPDEEDIDWSGGTGGDGMIVFDRAANALLRHKAPSGFGYRDTTGDGADEPVVDRDASGVGGCCNGITVFAQQAGSLRELPSVTAFGSVGIVNLDGNGVHEVVGDARLPSSAHSQRREGSGAVRVCLGRHAHDRRHHHRRGGRL